MINRKQIIVITFSYRGRLHKRNVVWTDINESLVSYSIVSPYLLENRLVDLRVFLTSHVKFKYPRHNSYLKRKKKKVSISEK